MIVSFIVVGFLFPSNNDCPLTMKFVDCDVIVDEIRTLPHHDVHAMHHVIAHTLVIPRLVGRLGIAF